MKFAHLVLASSFVALTGTTGCMAGYMDPAPRAESDAGTRPAPTPDAAVVPDAAVPSDDRPAAMPPPVTCEAGLSNCSGACRDTQNNVAHCGACGNACATGANCVRGACVAPPVANRCGNNICDAGETSTSCINDCRSFRVVYRGTWCDGRPTLRIWGPLNTDIPGVPETTRTDTGSPKYRGEGSIYIPRTDSVNRSTMAVSPWRGYVVFEARCGDQVMDLRAFRNLADAGFQVFIADMPMDVASGSPICRNALHPDPAQRDRLMLTVPFRDVGFGTCPADWAPYAPGR